MEEVEEKREGVEVVADETSAAPEAEALPDIVLNLKADYEAKIADLETRHAAEIADRDQIIQQLITTPAGAGTPRASFVDRINHKRDFKKW